jgi:hypothetical protein
MSAQPSQDIRYLNVPLLPVAADTYQVDSLRP